eukprot:5891247-Prymnesium_polylepis.1
MDMVQDTVRAHEMRSRSCRSPPAKSELERCGSFRSRPGSMPEADLGTHPTTPPTTHPTTHWVTGRRSPTHS